MHDTPEPTHDRPRPIAHRVHETGASSAPRTAWWWLALALTGLMALVVVITVAWSVSKVLRGGNRSTGYDPTTSQPLPGPNIQGGSFGTPVTPVDHEHPDKLTTFFARFGTTILDPKAETDDLFDWTDLSTAVPDDAIEFPVTPDGNPQAANWYGRIVVQNERTVWKQWDWAKVNVRKVNRRPDGLAVEAIVWHPTRDGRVVKRRWTLTEWEDTLRVVGWEDLRTGVTARDRTYARAVSGLSPSVRRQRQWQFDDVNQVHRLIDERKWEEATKLLDRLRTVRFDGELQYAIDLAEGRLALMNRVLDDGEWDQDLAIEILEELVAKHPERLAGYHYLAEAHLLGEEYGRVIEVCDALLTVTNDDPDMLALRGAARYALIQPDEASADFLAALTMDKYQPRALNWQRQQATDVAGRKAVADTLSSAPNPAAIFDALAGWATSEADWPGLLALAEKYREIRPKDTRWLNPLVTALVKSDRVDEAVTVFQIGIKVAPATDRVRLVEHFAQAMMSVGQAERVYALVPVSEAPTAFRTLAEHFEYARQRWVKQADPGLRLQRKSAANKLKTLLTAHRKAYPDDPWLALHDGRLKLDNGEYQVATEVFAPALAKLTYTGDAVKDHQSGYQPLLRELVTAMYKCEQVTEAYRDLKPHTMVFYQLVEMILSEKDSIGLTKLLDARKQQGHDTPDELYWRAEVDRLAKRYADAASKYSEYLKENGSNPEYQWIARSMLIRCLVRTANIPAAERAIDTVGTVSVPAELRALVLAKAGKAAEAERLLRELLANRPWANWLYLDEDLAPLLYGADFDAFRKDFPPTETKQLLPP